MNNNKFKENTINTTKEDKKYNLKNDVIFKAFFAKKGNEQFLIDFLTGLLKVEIKEIQINEEANLLKMTNIQKGGRLDLKATLPDGTIVCIEMQVSNEGNIENRTEFYGAKVLTNETKEGTFYEDIKQVIMVNILNFNLLDVEEYVSDTVIVLNEHREYEIPSLIKYYFIELPKFRKQNPDMNDKLNQWLALIDDMDRGRIKMAEEKNEKIKSALDEIGTLTGDAEVRRMAELQEKWERDWNSSIAYASKKAEEKGKKAGERKAKLETAEKMLEKEIPIETIIEITGLTKEEIMNLNN